LFSPDRLLLLVRDLLLTQIDIEFVLHMNIWTPFMESVLSSESSRYLNLHSKSCDEAKHLTARASDAVGEWRVFELF
jgi:hypothetical protein